MSRGLALTFILQLCAFLQWGHGQTVLPDLGAAQFFDDIEVSVQLIGQSALANYRNRQELWSSCNSDTRCSIYSCNPLRLDAHNSECLTVVRDGSGVCGNTTVDSGVKSLGCRNANFSKSSYIRLPPKADVSKLTCDTQMAICAQKNLDQQAFERVYANDSGPFNRIAWAMFGGSNGVFRIYPGLELPPDTCNPRTYDPRTRPWYKAVLSVSKQVVVLLDTGGSMANPLTVLKGNGVQIFTAAQSITRDFLYTLTAGDVVSIYRFDSSGARIIGEKVDVLLNDTLNERAFQPLEQAIKNISVSLTAASADLPAALETVLFNGAFASSPTIVRSLKIILIITAGELAGGPSVTIPTSIIEAVTKDEIRTFIYRLKDSSEGADVSELADLKSLACSLIGSYDEIPRENILDEPISALGSFYSYVAGVRFSLVAGAGPQALWVPAFEPVSVGEEVVSVVYPVFDGAVLVGVANICLLKAQVEATWPGAIVTRQKTEVEHNPGQPLNCNVSLMPEPLLCPDDTNTERSRGLCFDNSFPSSPTLKAYRERYCCDGGCGLSEKPDVAPKTSTESSFGKAGVIGVASAAVVLLLVFLLILWYSRSSIREIWNGCMKGTPGSAGSNLVNGASLTSSAAVTRANGADGRTTVHHQASDMSSPEPHPLTPSPVTPHSRGGYDIAL